MSSSEFKCNSNTLICSWIRCELSELFKFYKICPKVENVHIMPLVPQIVVITCIASSPIWAEIVLGCHCFKYGATTKEA